MFSTADALQKYGLKQETFAITNPIAEAMQLSDQSVSAATGNTGQFILGSIFKRAYKTLQTSANNYQQNASLKRKAMWAINDKAKFLKLITEIKGFNDSLASLFPDIVSKTADTLRIDIQESEEIRSLVILQEASADDHLDISDSASDRLERLGATVTDTHTILAGDQQPVKAPPKRAKTKNEVIPTTSSSEEVVKVSREDSHGNEDYLDDVVSIEDVSEDVRRDEDVDELTKKSQRLTNLLMPSKKEWSPAAYIARGGRLTVMPPFIGRERATTGIFPHGPIEIKASSGCLTILSVLPFHFYI